MAAPISQYVLRGGPCDGETGEITPEIGSSGQLVCQGGLYKFAHPAKVVDGHQVMKYAGKAPTVTATLKTPHTHKGWHHLQHSVNVNLPKSLRTSQRQTNAALRVLARARRVRL